MIAQAQTQWKPLGRGKISPPGAIADRDLAKRIAAYKRQVAGRYQSVAPADLLGVLPTGECILSPKIDGETWFLQATGGEAWLLSPSGKVVADIPVTEEARQTLAGHDLLLAGELYANGQPTRPRVHDLHAALGGGENAQAERLHFAAFDLIEESGLDAQRIPFPTRADRLLELLGRDGLCHNVAFESASNTQEVVDSYERLVTRDGHEGIVIRAADGRILKVKPEITIDAAVVGFTERTAGSVAELLLALMRPDGRFQLIGRVDTGFTRADRIELAERLRTLVTDTSYLAPARSGALFRFVRPQVVVEVKCNDLLAERSGGDPIRRMSLRYDTPSGWDALGHTPAVSMINAVFRRVRDDKPMTPEAVRLSQVTDLILLPQAAATHQDLARSQMLRRDVLTKKEGGRLCVRKAVVWKTNKEQVVPLYPAYVAFFTDFVPGRKQPLKTSLRVASTSEKICAIADAWLERQTGRGWKRHDETREMPCLPISCRNGNGFQLNLEITFARTASVNFHVAVRRMKALRNAGAFTVENDDKGRPRFYSFAFRQDALIENIRRIENLYRVIWRWKGAEVMVNGDPLGLHDVQSVFNAIGDVAACWRLRSKRTTNGENPCRTSCALGCKRLQFKASADFPGIPREHPAWYAVGNLDGKIVRLDKKSLLAQLDGATNETLALCPYFGRSTVDERIGNLPEKLDPKADSARWAFGYSITATDRKKPVWVFPKSIRRLPFDVTLEPRNERLQKVWNSALQAAGLRTGSISAAPARPGSRSIPVARYSDVCGQDAAVEAVRDYAELPLKHAELFKHVGVRPGRGILLWGPPGNGKTLLARAVAGESDAHIETICGPEVLSKWVGEAERRVREIFERAQRLAPSVILIDEIDAVAGARDATDSHHLRELVSQLLVLLDGLTDRGRLLVIATTNRPDAVDPAILRPGRIDRKVYMGPPDLKGRATLFEKLLGRMPVAEDVIALALAKLTKTLSGAQVEHVVNEAGLLAIKEAIASQLPTEAVRVGQKHLLCAADSVRSGS